jgi:predicted HTH domain antitoxin
MKKLSMRIPDDMMEAAQLVAKEEKIEPSTAMRKLVRIGYETYVGNLYKQGKVTLRGAASLLNLNLMENVDLLLDAGIAGNLDATDVLTSLRRFNIKRPDAGTAS